jgi:branched-chain amino acid transport system substrate-binding protein
MLHARRRLSRAGIIAGVCVLALPGCGTMMSRQQLIEGAGGGTAVSAGAASGSTAAGASGSSQSAGSGTSTSGSAGSSAATGPVGGAGGGAATGTSGSADTGGGTGTAAAASGGASGPVAAAGCTTANRTPVVIGSVGTYSGVLGADIEPAVPTLEAWVKYVNAQGGVDCHPVEVYVDDDQGSTANAESDTEDLVQNKHAVALVSSFIPDTASGVQAYVDPHHIPVVGGDGFTPWDSDPMLFNEGSNIDTQVYATEKYSAELGKTKWAVLYCAESSVCSSGNALADKYASSAGIQIVDSEETSVAQPNFTANCLNARSAGAQVIYNIGDSTSMFRLADNCASQGYHPLIATASNSMTDQQTTDSNLNGLFGTNAVAPWMLASLPGLVAFHQAMATYAPTVVLNGTSIMAWTSAEMFAMAIDNVAAQAKAGPITTQMVLDGLWMMHNETLGGLAPKSLNFQQGQPGQIVKCAFITQIQGGKWTAPIGLQQICRS